MALLIREKQMRLRWVLPILKHKAYCRFMKTVTNTLGFAQSDIAGLRLRCITILKRQGYAGVKLAFPRVSRRSVFRWQETYFKSGKQFSSLIPKSTKPHLVRTMTIPPDILGFIKAVRQQHPRLSKYKLKIFLDEFCKGRGLPLFSVSWIGKVISRNSFFFDTRKPVKKQRKSKGEKLRIFRCPRQKDISLGYLQADGLKVCWNGQTLYFLCAVELVTRQAFVKRVPSLSSQQARDFLLWIKAQVGYRIHTVQTDNGSEFHGYCQEALADPENWGLDLTHLWSLPHSPQVNGYIERFNGIIQEEFIDYHVDTGVVDKPAFDQLLSDWLIYYNTRRPHHGLNLKTPQQRLLELQSPLTFSQSAKCV